MKRFALSFILFLIIVCPSWSQDCSSGRYLDTLLGGFLVYQNIQYATADPYGILPSQDLHLDFYEPFGDTLSERPLILFSYGGAFLIGDKSQPFVPDFCRYYAKRGYVAAAINYRLGFNTLDQGSAERAVYRTVQDIRAALRFLVQRGQAYRIDTSNIFLAGTSAGCVASLHSTFMAESDRPASTYGTLLEPEDLGCADCSGNNDFNNQEVRVKGIVNCWGAMLDTVFIEGIPQENVPVISFHGTADLIVPYVYGYPFQLPIFPPMFGSKLIHQRLDHFGVYNVLRPFSAAAHEPELYNWAYADTIFTEGAQFLYEILRPKTSAIYGETTLCVNEREIYAVDLHAGNEYCWNVTGGTVLSQSLNQVQILWTDTGYHQISVKEIDKIQAVSEESALTVYIVPQAISQFEFEHFDGNVSFTNYSENSVHWFWDFGNGSADTSRNPTYIYNDAGTYAVSLESGNGLCTDTAIKQVYVEFCPVSEFDITINGLIVSLTNQSINSSSVLWDFGDGFTTALTDPVYIYKEPGSYTIKLVSKNNTGCSDTVFEVIKIYNAINTGLRIDADLEETTIFPNPTSDVVYLSLNGENWETAKLEMYALDGLMVMQRMISENRNFNKIDVSNLSVGIYNLKIILSDQIIRKKIVKL